MQSIKHSHNSSTFLVKTALPESQRKCCRILVELLLLLLLLLLLQPRIEKSGNIVDISEKYRISGINETIIATNYRSMEKSPKNWQNHRYIGEISVFH